MAEFTIPEFLQNHSTNDNHKRMREIIPSDIDMSEGGHAWNMTRPSALLASRMCEFILPEVIKLIFPEYSYGEILDNHAKSRKMSRRAATAALGQITITGTANIKIPAGSLFSTPAVNGESSVDYETMEAATIPASGSVTVDVQCTKTGTVGNTAANTIRMNSSRITGITDVNNEEPVMGGTEQESDDALIERILAYDRSQGDNYVGCVADYKRWAKEVPGVGEATVISAQDTSGLVTIIVTDANGDPATTQLCESVYNHIMRPDSPYERLAPVNAYLEVIPPYTAKISVTATVELIDGATLEAVKEDFAARLAAYLPVAMDEGEIKYTRVAAALAATEGANDYTGLQLGMKDGETVSWGTANIPITTSQLPTIDVDDLILTAGTV